MCTQHRTYSIYNFCYIFVTLSRCSSFIQVTYLVYCQSVMRNHNKASYQCTKWAPVCRSKPTRIAKYWSAILKNVRNFCYDLSGIFQILDNASYDRRINERVTLNSVFQTMLVFGLISPFFIFQNVTVTKKHKSTIGRCYW